MAVLNQQRNQKGVQTLGLEFQDLMAAGHGYMIPHTNGNIYCVFARNFDNAVAQRRIYISQSSDHGGSWSAPVQLTSGNWDDNPAGLQLDTTSTASDIGIVFTRAASVIATNDQIMYRIGVAVAGFGLTTPVDPITGTPSDIKSLSLVKIAAGFAIFAINSSFSSSASVFKYTNTAFSTNTWSLTTLANFWGGTTLTPFSLSVKRLTTGDLGAISVVRTALNGSSSTSVGNMPAAIIRADVMMAFSADDGVTWSSPQNLTNYSATPSLDLVGQTIAFDADFTCLSDGTVVAAYQEALAPQFISDSTTLAIPANAGGVSAFVYHSGHNMLIVGSNDPTNGGVWVFDLTNQTRTRIFTSSTPFIWGNAINDLSVSSDSKYLAIAHTAGLEIVDTTDPLVANWTITSLRTTTTPATRVAPMAFCKFDTTGYVLYIAYGTSSVTDVWGFFVDASNIVGGGLTDLQSATGGGVANIPFVNVGSFLVGFTGSKIIKTFKSNGTSAYTTNVSGSAWQGVIFDDVNSEYVFIGVGNSVDGIHRVADSGSAFSISQSFSTSTNPSAPSNLNAAIAKITGSGFFYQVGASGAESMGFYSFGEQKPMGYIAFYRFDQSLGENNYSTVLQAIKAVKTSSWLLTSTLNSPSVQLINLVNSGRIRYGFFPYNTGTHQLTTAGVDFFDMVNPARVGPYTKLQKFRFCSDNTDALAAYFRKVDFSVALNQYAAMNGHVEPDAFKLFMQARILKTPTVAFQARARIRTFPTKTLDTKALIVFAQCFYARANIVPIKIVTSQMRANIFGRKSNAILNSFNVQRAGQTITRMIFFAGTGNASTQNLSVGARVVRASRSVMSGHFIVYNTQTGPLRLGFNTNQASLQQIGIQANIVRP